MQGFDCGQDLNNRTHIEKQWVIAGVIITEIEVKNNPLMLQLGLRLTGKGNVKTTAHPL